MKPGKRIASNGLVILMTLAVMAFVTAGKVHADNWVAFSGAERLEAFVAGGTAEIELKPGVLASGEYYENGSAKIKAWGETFQRTWEVRGDDQVCYSKALKKGCPERRAFKTRPFRHSLVANSHTLQGSTHL